MICSFLPFIPQLIWHFFRKTFPDVPNPFHITVFEIFPYHLPLTDMFIFTVIIMCLSVDLLPLTSSVHYRLKLHECRTSPASASAISRNLGYLAAYRRCSIKFIKWRNVSPILGKREDRDPRSANSPILASTHHLSSHLFPPGTPNICRFSPHCIKQWSCICHKNTAVFPFKMKFKYSNELIEILLYTHFFNTLLKFSFLTFFKLVYH